MSSTIHVLVVPFIGHGHVAPLMKFSQLIANHGIKVTVVNTDTIHEKIMAAFPQDGEHKIRLVSIPDGLDPDDDRNNLSKMVESMLKVMPGHLKSLIQKLNHENNDDCVTCVIADPLSGWALEVAMEMGIRRAAFWPVGAGSLAFDLYVPKLIEAGYLDDGGTIMKSGLIRLSEDIPEYRISDFFPWTNEDEPKVKRILLEFIAGISKTVRLSNWVLCNSFYEFDPFACNLVPGLLPVGPFLSSKNVENNYGNFYPEDESSLKWLDEQPAGSVIYVAFGSLAVLSKNQFFELAHALQLTGKPFLWVIRSDENNESREYPDGFKEKLADIGKIVEWAPQEQVLGHPSTGCFFSHCGWSSALEGLSYGVPFLCWPQFGDHFHNKGYICDVWKVGLGLDFDENGFITREEIQRKIEALVCDDGIKENAKKIKDLAVKSINEDGSSVKNLEKFIEQLKG